MDARTCPTCAAEIPTDDINVQKDTALCRACGTPHAFSDLIHRHRKSGSRIADPPPRTWVRTEPRGHEMTTVIGAEYRNYTQLGGLLFACAFWNGIVSIFVWVAIEAWLVNLGIIPQGAATPINDAQPDWGMTIFLTLFLTPFVLIGTGIFIALAMSMFGKAEVRISRTSARLFRGIGPIGFGASFNPAEVTSVHQHTKRSRDSDGDVSEQTSIVIDAHREIRFGSNIPAKRRSYLTAALREALEPKSRRSRTA